MGYELMHLIRSLSYVYELENIPCDQEYYGMSAHVKQAAIELEEIGQEADRRDELPARRRRARRCHEVLLPDDDMSLGLLICQTRAIWDGIHHVPTQDRTQKPLLMCNLVELASCNGVMGIYAGAGESIRELGPGIAHAASWAYKKLGDKKMLNKDSSVVPPLVFKDTFLPLMKALLISRVIAKAPLGDANDIRGLVREKAEWLQPRSSLPRKSLLDGALV